MSLNKNGFLIIERNKDQIWKNLPLGERKDILNYRGFDGLRWPLYQENKENFILYNGLGDISDETLIYSLFDKISTITENPLDLLLLNNPIRDFNKKCFIGYDVGVIEEYGDPVFFSGILNEIRTNGNKYITEKIKSLNNNYLFDTISDCNEYLSLREIAFNMQNIQHLETAYQTNQMEIISIYLEKSNC